MSDSLYGYDEEKLEALGAQLPWMKDPKYFKQVKISPSAAIKMMSHGQTGVDKGIKANGKPIEVMGLLLGKPDTEDPTAFVISDAQPLPCEGFETQVVVDDDRVINFMIEAQESNELTRKEGFCGWYHTHPFDVDVNSHCFLSNTDITTQLQWQRSEDPNGRPWLAIVIDPLRSLAKGKPELAAFRVYPPDYTPPMNETPDGTIVTDDRARVEKWGVCWARYYKLKVTYFMSSLAKSTLGILKDNFLWMNPFTSSQMLEPEQKQRVAERLGNIADRMEVFESRGTGSGSFRGMGGMMKFPGVDADSEKMSGPSEASEKFSSGSRGDDDSTFSKTSQSAVELAVEQCQGCISQLQKDSLFGTAVALNGSKN